MLRVPYEWTGDSYLFDFGSLPVEKLANYNNYLFKKNWYALEEGNPINGIYSKSNYSMRYGFFSKVNKFKVEIYSVDGNTYLEISKGKGGFISVDRIIYGKNYMNSELNRMAEKIQFLKPEYNGSLVCKKCGGYYELQYGESPDDFTGKCECGGTLKYLENPNFSDKEPVEKKKTSSPKKYLRAPVALILVSLGFMMYGSDLGLILGIFSLGFGAVFILIRFRESELILDNIYRRIIYFFISFLFLFESYALFIVWLQSNYNTITNIGPLVFASIGLLFGLSLIYKTISPDNPRNLLDPPL